MKYIKVDVGMTLKTETIFKLEFFLMFGIVLFTILGKSNIVSVLFYTTFFVLLFGVSLQIKTKIGKREIYALGCVFFALFGTLLTMNSFSLLYFRKVIMFSCTILFFVLTSRTPISQKTVEMILKINISIALLYPIAYYVLNVRITIARGLTFNFSNPNLTGMFLLHSILYLILAFIYYKKKTYKLGIFLLIVILTAFLNKTLARSCIVSLILFLLLIVINLIRKNTVKITKIMSFFLTIVPLAFVVAYIWMIKSDFIRIFDFAISEGKPLTSRYYIWMSSVEKFMSHPIIGNYGFLDAGSGASQLHNTHIDTLVTYGILTFVLFIGLLNECIYAILPVVKSLFQKCSLFAFFAIIIQGTFEAALVSGGVGLYILSGGFLVIARWNDDSDC